MATARRLASGSAVGLKPDLQISWGADSNTVPMDGSCQPFNSFFAKLQRCTSLGPS